MIQKQDILRMAKHVFKRGRGIPDKRLFHPQRDWTIGLLLFISVFVFGSIIAGQSFVKNQDIQTDTIVLSEQIPAYNKVLVEKTLDAYGERRNNFKLQNIAPAPVVGTTTQATTTDSIEDSSQESVVESDIEEEQTPVLEEEKTQPVESSGSLLEAN